MPLSPERWQHIKTIFGDSLEVDAAQRARFVVEQAGGDRELEREVSSLLHALEQEADRFERPVLDSLADADDMDEPSAPTLVGRRVGAYDVIREIGHGGMGVVYEATRADDQYHRRVAIKTIWRGGESQLILGRFRQERQILAGLSHPNIAGLFDGGMTDDGQPYLVMEYIDGVPIDVWCRQQRLTITQRLALFQQVCSAVQYAHRNLIVHRDLKPGNILVTSEGVVKLLDFGIAKLMEEGGGGEDHRADVASLTRGGLHPLTTTYASPEQVRGEAITTASDVYSLGVVLYELLAGSPPFSGTGLSPMELQRHISDEPPRRPSGAVTAVVAEQTGEGSVPKLARALAGELDAIVLMALRKEPERRYSSVELLSLDLSRYLAHLPVSARPDTLRYRARKFGRRFRAAVIAGSVAVLALVAGIVGVVSQGRTAARERDRARTEAELAQHERENAEQVSRFLQGVVGAANPSWDAPSERLGGDSASNSMLDAVARRVDSELAGLPQVKATVLRTLGKANLARARYDVAERQLSTALDLHLQVPGPGGVREVAIDRSSLGVLGLATGRLQQADSQFAKAYSALRSLNDTTSMEYARAVNDWGLVLLAQGRVAEAAPRIDETLRVMRGLGRDSTGEYAIAMGNAALMADNVGKLDDAERLYRGSLDAFARVRGRDFYERGFTLHNLAIVKALKGEYTVAESLMLAADSLWTRFLGGDHPAVAVSQIGLARVYHAAGRESRALERLHRAEAILRRHVTTTHPDMSRLDAVYGQVLVSLGRIDEGERRLRSALRIRRTTLKASDWRLGETTGALGIALTRKKAYAEAEPLLQESYAVLRGAMGVTHPRTLDAGRNLLALYEQWGRSTQADSVRLALGTNVKP
ncbi:MAG: serine/threonine-protein kinase [Gemmatimonadaceae bacterium]